MVFCPGVPGPLSGVHMPSQDHLSGAAGPVSVNQSTCDQGTALTWSELSSLGVGRPRSFPAPAWARRRGVCWEAEWTVCPQGCCHMVLVSESGWQPRSPPIPLIHPSPIPPLATTDFLLRPCIFLDFPRGTGVNNPAVNAGDIRDPVFSPWIRKIPWRRAQQPTSVFLLGESPWTEEPGGLQSMGSQRAGHDWSNLTLAQVI